MVLDTSLYKVLSWLFMGLISSELYSLEIRIQKIVFYCFYRLRLNYIRLNNLKTTGAKLSRFVISNSIEAIINLLW